MINIAFISDENYVLPTLTSVQSIVLNTKTKTNIYIILTSEHSDDIESFEQLSTELVSVKVIKMENPLTEIKTAPNYVSKAALIKFMLPNIFSDLDKILYIDGDTLILNDLSEMYNTNLENNYAAVILDYAGMNVIKEHLSINVEKYFNSGVMLLNLSKMRNDNITETLIETKENAINDLFMDQNTFNKIFNKNFIILPPQYNLMKANLNYALEDIANFYNISSFELEEILKSPVILHLTNANKPWNNINAPEFEYWIKYFSALPVGLQTKYLLKTLNKYKITNSEKIENLQNQINEKNMQILDLQNKICNAENNINHLNNCINNLNIQTENLNTNLRILEEKVNNTLLSKIFSIKNKYTNNSKHKILTILGIKMKFRSK